jgi:predicted DNA binding protein
MSDGIRATVAFSAPGNCPLAEVSARAGTTIEQVSTNVTLPDANSVTEFIAPSSLDQQDISDTDIDAVFSYGESTVYRTVHESPVDCPCETVGSFDCPVHRYVADEGTLTLVFHAPNFESLQSIMATLREQYPSVDVQRLLQPPLDGSPEDRVFVNRGKLTDRQLEVLTVAYDRGYFERPKQANATEIAESLGIAQSTFTEHLVAAQRKLLGDLLE